LTRRPESRWTDVEEGYAGAEHPAVLQTLTLRERNAIRLRFEHDLTQAEIGAHIGVSQMQVSRILRHSIARLGVIAAAHE
jgi:RNA polymerase sigma-B factor